MIHPLPEFTLVPSDYGWTGRFPTGPHLLFGREVNLEVHTRAVPDEPEVLPPISATQASLVRTITSALPALLRRVEKELIEHNGEFDAEFQNFIRNPHVWLSKERDDGVSWTLVVERTDNPDFGYHAEFKGTEFMEIWSGD